MSQLLESVVLPVVVAILAYVLVDRLGEWKKRRATSILGVVVIDSLLEEVRGGLDLMKSMLKIVNEPGRPGPMTMLLPHQSWAGMSTLSDDVMLRIIAVTNKKSFVGFSPRDLRSHCKNYFTHMTSNYEATLKLAIEMASAGQEWKPQFDRLLRTGEQPYVEAAQGVVDALENARRLLDDNSRRCVPK